MASRPQGATDKIIADDLYKCLRKRMKVYGGFLQVHMIGEILTDEAISDLLDAYSAGNGGMPIPSHRNIARQYRTILAVLIMIGEWQSIFDFERHSVDDKSLPLRLHEAEDGNERLCFPSSSALVPCCIGWVTWAKVEFVQTQERLMVPHLTATSKGEFEPQHLDLTSRTLPWHVDLGVNGVESIGGFSKVHCVQIPPDFHSFHHWIAKLGLNSTKFALKQLEPKSADLSMQFSKIQVNNATVENVSSTTDAHRREYEQLRNFHGFVNKHLITMLASYQYKQQHYIMFPWADKSLVDYWAAHSANPCDVSESQWFFSQLRGILSAVHDIHEPKHIKGKNGRHGDIKPENIVWFDLRDESRGIFVLTDMGLTSLHREVTRSVVPNDKVAHTPTYHPPELVIEKGQISRAYDIWTLGCLFLEMSIWFTMGHDSLDEFHDDRLLMDSSPRYFEIVPVKRDEVLLTVPNSSFEYGVKVKDVVFEWFDRVRNSPKATQMIRDIVDLIETRMILVLARGTARATSASLMEQFDGINSKVHNKAGGVRYCSSPVRAGTGERQRAPAVVVAIPLRDIWSKRVKSRIQSLGLKPEAAVDFNRSYTAQEYEDMYNQ